MNLNRSENGRTIRRIAAIFFVVAFALLSSGRIVVKEYGRVRSKTSPDAITRNELRFEKLRHRLPTVGPVGYFRMSGENRQDKLDPFYAAQYALSPVVLLKRTDLPLVVGNFDPTDPQPKRPADPRLVLVEDFGDGVMLFRRETK